LKRPDRLVVDANPVLSALLGGQPRRVFLESNISEFAVPERVIDEARRYVPRLAQKLRVEPAFLEYALNLLPLRSTRRAGMRGLSEKRGGASSGAIRPTSTSWLWLWTLGCPLVERSRL
jgi:hypothetical protein